MGGVVLVTGATGFLGTEIAGRLLECDVEIVALVRGADPDEAMRSAVRAWWHRPALRAALGSRIRVVTGDVGRPGLGLEPMIERELAGRVTNIVHAAADLRLDASVGDLRRTNVDGVAHVLTLARAAPSLRRLVHVSTAYVAGRRTGAIAEEDLSDADGFENAYERTKYEGERLVRAAMPDLPVVVVRPAMIVGDSRTGDIKMFNTFYAPLRSLLRGEARVVPARRDLRVNIVPVDYVADAIVRLLTEADVDGRTFHVTLPADRLPVASEVVGLARAWAAERLGVRLPRPWFVPLPLHMRGRAARLLAPYFRERRVFLRDETDRVLGTSVPDWRAFVPVLLERAVERGFLHRSGRTVHEQILFRLGGHGHPVAFTDVDLEGRVGRRTAGSVRSEALQVAAALRARGIGVLDRVAVVGSNGTRYLALDVGIGLVGAVSVPLYPTTPPREIDDLVRRSRARLLFVGSAAALGRLDDLEATVPVVTFGTAPTSESHHVLGWSRFLAAAEGTVVPERAPVGPDDLATIRYTSGTTGPPKGVAFTHGQLAWMAEAMAGLIPWGVRMRPMRYVSFFPLSHVVEGILAFYGAYEVPAPVEITFVEDFRHVPSALRRARPSVFFSVPRLYEKVWNGVRSSRTGRRYLRMREGVGRRVLATVIRRRMLRRAGLDRCGQLIAGSAPVDERLLRSFRALGVEVHDAYGLTEAPLIALNRPGRNRIGTVGEPLPQTEIRIAPDGEVLVRGPQVTLGYVDEPDQPFVDGWLATGDLGRLTREGALVVDGRKKDVLKTSYGKYVQPSKIEAMLRGIPGVSEAMVVGEGRPFCAALLWTDGADEGTIARAVDAVNRRLSHPEQVKRWEIFPNDLSVDGGDLTANLKLKRRRLETRFADAITSLYDGDRSTAAEVFTG